MPLTSTAALDARSLPALAASLLRDCSRSFQGLDLILHLRDARGQIGRRAAQHARDLRQQRVLVLHPGERIVASNGFDAAHASGHAALGHDLEQADVAGAGHVGAAAEFAREADIQHAHGVAVFLAEQRHGAALDRVVIGHDLRHGGLVGQDLSIDDGFHAGDLLGGQRRVLREVETGLVGIDQRAALLDVSAQHLAQRLVHQVGGGVVAHGARGRTASTRASRLSPTDSVPDSSTP